MDLLTQGLLGSAMALSAARPHESRQAVVIGLLAGIAADVDFFISSSTDPLLNLEYHRHFTHSIFFVPLAALLISFLLWPVFKKQLSWNRIFIFSLFGYLFSGLLDACTSYGTSLLWPLSDQRISFNIISIIDPIFSLLLLAGVISASIRKNPRFAQLSLFMAALYLALGWLQHQRVEQISLQLAQQRGHHAERLLVKPTLGNLFLWRSIYLHQNTFYIDAIRLNPFTAESRLFPGEYITRFDSRHHQLNLAPDSVLQKDIERFSAFTSDFLAIHPAQSQLIHDVRYSNLPTSSLPLWGISFDPDKPEQHARYHLFRDSSRETRDSFMQMLLNQ